MVAGSGFAGVETVGAINDLARESLAHYGRIDPREVRVVLIGGKAILAELGEALGSYAQEKLKERQVEIKLGAKIVAYADGVVHCSDGEAIATDTLIWAAGVAPSPILKDIPCELQKGRVVVDSTLEVPGLSGVWAVGDCAAIIEPTSTSLSSDRSACYSRGAACGQEHLRPLTRQAGRAVPVQDGWAARDYWPAHRCCQDLRPEVFGICRMVTLADCIPDETIDG